VDQSGRAGQLARYLPADWKGALVNGDLVQRGEAAVWIEHSVIDLAPDGKSGPLL